MIGDLTVFTVGNENPSSYFFAHLKFHTGRKWLKYSCLQKKHLLHKMQSRLVSLCLCLWFGSGSVKVKFSLWVKVTGKYPWSNNFMSCDYSHSFVWLDRPGESSPEKDCCW